MRKIAQHKPLINILLLFIALGAVYNLVLPLFEAPDEMDHFRYADWLAAGRMLPHLQNDLGVVGHEIGQPPLYYAVLAPFISWIDRGDLYTVAPLNPYWRGGGGIYAHYHTSTESFPFHHTTLAVHVARFVTTLFACLTIISTYGIARLIIPEQAIWAAALVALNPMYLFISAAVSNDTLVAGLSTLVIWGLVWQIYSDTVRRPFLYLLLGGLWGLATLTKMNSLSLGGLIFLGFVMTAWLNKKSKPILIGLPITLASMIGVTGWWFVRNYKLYGNFLAWDAFLNANKGLIRPELLTWSETLAYAGFLRRTVWATFGYGGLQAPTIFYSLINTISLLAFVGLIIWFVQKKSILSSPKAFSLLLLLVWSLVSFASLMRWMQQVSASNQGRLLFPAFGSLAVLIIFGLSKLGRHAHWLGRIAVVDLAVVALVAPFMIISPAYATPAPLVDNAEIPNKTDIHFGEGISLAGYGLPEVEVFPNDPLEINLYWQVLRSMSESYVVAVHLIDSSGRVVSGTDSIPYNKRYPTAVWETDMLFEDKYTLPPIQTDASAGLASIYLTIYPVGRSKEPLPVFINDIPVGNGTLLSTIKIAPNKTIHYSPQIKRADSLGNVARLFGYDAPGWVQVGQSIPIKLYWETIEPDGRDYTTFIHILDENGQLIAQEDSPPQAGKYPTSIWAPGEQIPDDNTIILSADAPAGKYTIFLGMYDPITGHRLPAFNESGDQWLNDAIVLQKIEIKP